MLIQSLKRMEVNSTGLPNLKNALICLLEHKDDSAPARIDFADGYLLLQEGDTKGVEDGDYEAHRRYLDVQVLLEGEETVVWNDISTLVESVPYDQEKDKVMYSGEGSHITIRPGTCYVCWPEDGHKACRHMGQPTHYRKAVIKLPI